MWLMEGKHMKFDSAQARRVRGFRSGRAEQEAQIAATEKWLAETPDFAKYEDGERLHVYEIGRGDA
jgi:hypothetical protein